LDDGNVIMTPITPHGVDRAPKFDMGPVSRGLDDAAAVLGYLGIDEFASMSLKRRWGQQK
jgi:hypothetical protein